MNYTPEQISSIVLKVLKEIETPEILELTFDQKLELAQNPNTPPETLVRLASNKNYVIVWAVAQNPNTPPKTLEVLTSDEDYNVRESAKKNLEENYKTHNLKLTTNQYNALKTLITASQDETLKGLMDS